MRASSTLIATRSSDSAARPPACPTPSTMSGSAATIASSSASSARPNTQGRVALTISRSPSRSGNRCTASSAGLTLSPPNGSNPVTRAFTRGLPASGPYRDNGAAAPKRPAARHQAEPGSGSGGWRVGGGQRLERAPARFGRKFPQPFVIGEILLYRGGVEIAPRHLLGGFAIAG